MPSKKKIPVHSSKASKKPLKNRLKDTKTKQRLSVKTNRREKEIYEKAIAKLKVLTIRQRDQVKKVLTQCFEESVNTEPLPAKQPVTKTGRIPEYCRSRSYFDKYGMGFTEFRPCPYELCSSWMVTCAKNRVTIVTDNMFDGHIRPVFTYYNIDNIPLKSQIDIYKKYVNKKKIIKSCDWIGTDEEVQLIVGDVSGTVARLDLQQRMAVNTWEASHCGVRLIRCHKETNVIAILDEENSVYFWVVDIETEDSPVLVASVDIKPNVKQMEWIGNKLVCLTDSEILEITSINPSDLVKQQKKLEKNPKSGSFKIVIKNIGDQDISNFKYEGDNTLLVQKNNGTLLEYDYSAKKLVHSLSSSNASVLKAGRGYALHPTKRILAVAGSQGTCEIVDYKNGRVLQTLRKRGNSIDVGLFMHWSKLFPDNLLMITKNRIQRYLTFGDRLVESKPALLGAYYENDIPFQIQYSAMDQTNIDHDHRAYQWHWGNDDDVSKKYHERDFDKETENRKKKIYFMDQEIQKENQERSKSKRANPRKNKLKKKRQKVESKKQIPI